MSEDHAFKQGSQPRGRLDQLPLYPPGTDSDDPPTYLTTQERQVASQKNPWGQTPEPRNPVRLILTTLLLDYLQ